MGDGNPPARSCMAPGRSIGVGGARIPRGSTLLLLNRPGIGGGGGCIAEEDEPGIGGG